MFELFRLCLPVMECFESILVIKEEFERDSQQKRIYIMLIEGHLQYASSDWLLVGEFRASYSHVIVLASSALRPSHVYGVRRYLTETEEQATGVVRFWQAVGFHRVILGLYTIIHCLYGIRGHDVNGSQKMITKRAV